MPRAFPSLPHMDGAVEIIDASGQPLCIVPACAAEAQSLPYRSVAVQIMSRDGCFLLSEKGSGLFDITAKAPLPAFRGLCEFAQDLQAECTGQQKKPQFIARLMPGHVYLFCAFYSRAMLEAVAQPGLLVTTSAEMAKLEELGLISPFLASILPGLNQGRLQKLHKFPVQYSI